jgi:hypothetical protein
VDAPDPSGGIVTAALPYVLGAAWGALLAVPLALRAYRLHLRARFETLAPASRSERRAPERSPGWLAQVGDRMSRTMVGRVATDIARRRRSRREDAMLGRDVPVTVDLLAVAVGAGCTPYGAVEVAARWAPPAVAGRLGAVPRACALGSGFGDALDQLAADASRLQPLTDALGVSDRLGAPIGPALAALGVEERAPLRRQAETHARTVPVRLLFPLVFLVLPAFGLLTVVPAVLAGLARS